MAAGLNFPTDRSMATTSNSLQKLKDWIDSPRPSDPNDNSWVGFLYKPEFSEETLKEGLIHAVAQLLQASTRCEKVARPAKQDSEKIDMKSWLENFNVDEPDNLCLLDEINIDDYEAKVRAFDIEENERSGKNFRRTIAVVAVLVQRIDQTSVELEGDVARTVLQFIE